MFCFVQDTASTGGWREWTTASSWRGDHLNVCQTRDRDEGIEKVAKNWGGKGTCWGSSAKVASNSETKSERPTLKIDVETGNPSVSRMSCLLWINEATNKVTSLKQFINPTMSPPKYDSLP